MSLESDWQAVREDVLVINVLTEDEGGGPVDEVEALEWRSEYGLTLPVVSDPDSATMWSYVEGGSVGLPFAVVIDVGGVVAAKGNPTIASAAALAD